MIAPVLAILLIAALVVIGPGTGDGRKNLFTSRIRDTIARNFQSAYADADAQHVYRRDVLDTNNTTPFLYTILPAESKNKTLTDAFQNKLFTLIPQNSTYTSQHNATGVLFWAANLTDSQISQLTTYNVSTRWRSGKRDKKTSSLIRSGELRTRRARDVSALLCRSGRAQEAIRYWGVSWLHRSARKEEARYRRGARRDEHDSFHRRPTLEQPDQESDSTIDQSKCRAR